MRTTLTLDNDLAAILQKKARQEGNSFKKVVNQVLRAGVAMEGDALPKRKRIRVVGKAMGLKAGFDPDRFNQLIDELEVEEFVKKSRRAS
jgi:hypothetical protein